MVKFPEPIPLPQTVAEERLARQKAVSRSVFIGLIIRTFIIIIELGAVAIYGSAALMMDALSTGLDVVTSLLLFVFMKLAERPPDENHPYGHGRYEPLAGLQLGLFLVVIGASMFFQQGSEVYHDVHEEVIVPYLWLIPTVAIGLLEYSCRYLKRTAKRIHSAALLSEANHFRADALTSLFAAVALFFAAHSSQWSGIIDHMGAISIALFMVFVGANSAWENIHQLMDRKPEPRYFKRVREAALRAEGARETEKIRIQFFGPDAHVHIDVEVDPNLSVEEAHRISQHVRAEIQKDWPAVRDVIVHIEPYYSGDH